MALKIHQLEMKQSTQAKKHQNHTGEEVIYHLKPLEKILFDPFNENSELRQKWPLVRSKIS